ncbi:MAG: endonuclease III [Clostridiales Family XIII bacterium]|jgi:endonuclease-3|nr:endonuclease III [Clostridiales Family XIII bacterium]
MMNRQRRTVLSKDQVGEVIHLLAESYPDAECALVHRSVWELIVAVALSAQTTDVSVNSVTPELFRRWPSPAALAGARQEEVQEVIRKIGMYRTKSANIIRLAQKILEDHDGEVPQDFVALVALPGVGRKTANVVLSVGFGEARIAVDTHVFRVSNRIGLCHEPDVLKTEEALMRRIPKTLWSAAHHYLIRHGRMVCHARKPDCEGCVVNEFCLYLK